MPVKIPHDLPARATLDAENVFVMTEERAMHQDIRPLRFAILNLMPTKIATETHLLRLLGSTPIQVEITLLRMGSHESRNTAPEHLNTFYRTFDDISDTKFDGLVITGAPVELLPFEEVDYWPELTDFLDWSQENVFSTMNVCWGAQAALYHRYGVPKYELDAKMFGVFEHHVLNPRSVITAGFDDVFLAPHSRHTETRAEDIAATGEVEVLAQSDEAGVFLAATRDGRQLFVTGHPEYGRDTLNLEYQRDVARGLPINIPKNYFPGDDPSKEPHQRWRSHAFLLYSNWLNHCVYQRTPYDPAAIPAEMPDVR